MSIDLVGPDGKAWVLDNDDPAALEEAFRQGYTQPVAPREKSTIEEVADPIAAAAFGAVQGVTGGALGVISGLAALPDRSGYVDPSALAAKKEMSRLQKENPLATLGGELAGAVASPINAISAAVEGPRAASVVGRIGQRAIGGAPVGALFGAGSTVSDALLGDAELSADKLIAGVGLGALLGFTGAGVGGAIEESARAVLPKLGRSMSDAQKVLDDLANDAAVKATRAEQGVIRRIGETKLAEAGKVLRERGHLKISPESIGESVSKDRAAVGAVKGGFLDAAEAAGSRPAPSGFLKVIDDLEATLGPTERRAIASDLQSARDAFMEIGSRPVGGTGKTGSGWRAFDFEKQAIMKRGRFSSGPAGVDDVTLGLKRQLAGVISDELDRQLLPALGKDAAAFLETKATYGALKDAERLAASGAGRAGGLGLKDLMTGTLAGMVHPGGIATALASKFMREHGPALVAKAADAIAKSPALTAVAQSMGTQVSAFTPKMGPYGIALAEAFQQGPGMGLATHMAMAQVDPNYAATAEAAGLAPEAPEEHSAALTRAHDLSAIAQTVKASDEAIEKYVEKVLRGASSPPASGDVMKRQDFGEKRMRRGPEAAYDKRAEEIRQLAADPSALLERLSKNLETIGPTAPGLTAALTARAKIAVQYLAKAAEVPPKAGPLAAEWVPTKAEKHTFAQKLEVVEDPMTVMHHAAAGTLTETQVEAMRTVYPVLYKQMADKALELAMGAKHVPYRSRMMLTLLAGVDVDGSLSHESIAANQTSIRATKVDKANASPPSGARDTEMTLAERTANPQQRREMEPSE